MMTSGEFSKRSGLSAKALRLYETRGLLKPTTVDRVNGYRLYAEDLLPRAVTIVLLRGAGVSLAEIARFLAEPTPESLQSWERELQVEARVRLECLSEVQRRYGWLSPAVEEGSEVAEVREVHNALELEKVLAVVAPLNDLELGDRRWDDIRRRFPEDQALMAIAVDGEEVVGGALAFQTGGGSATVRVGGVAPRWRRRGLGRQLVERVEHGAARVGVTDLALGTDDAVGFWFRLGYTPMLLLQWVYDATLFEEECRVLTGGVLKGLETWESSFNDVPQLFVRLDEPQPNLRTAVREAVSGCHVGFCMTMHLDA